MFGLDMVMAGHHFLEPNATCAMSMKLLMRQHARITAKRLRTRVRLCVVCKMRHVFLESRLRNGFVQLLHLSFLFLLYESTTGFDNFR